MPLLGSIIKKAYEIRRFPIDIKSPDPVGEQKRVLRRLLLKAQDTAFGEFYHFPDILTSGDIRKTFSENIPIYDYNSMFRSWWYRSLNGEAYVTWPGKVKYFALTSGTSDASSKQIPVTSDMLWAIRKATIRLLVSTTKYDFPDEFYEKGILMIGGSTHLQYNGTYYQGDVSGITAKDIPFWFQHFYKPGKHISREVEWQVKLNEIVRNAPDWDIGIVVGVPAWIQIIFERIISEYRLKSIHDIWPDFGAYVHSGVSFEPYVNSFQALLGKPIVYNESYLSSEGYIAYQHPESKSSMAMITDNGIYYEFIPFNDSNFDDEGNMKDNPEVLCIDQVETGKTYALLLSTCAGAWRYLIGDTLRFTDTKTCEILLTGRTKSFLSLCGEHLSQDNMNRAVKMLQDEMSIKINEFTVCGTRQGSLFGHKWYLGTEWEGDPGILAGKIDEYLKILNDDYRVERLEAIREIQLEIVPLQAFYDWMKARGKEGGAHKFPRVLKNRQLESWEEHLKHYGFK